MTLLPGQSPPLLPLDLTHRGALVVIAGAIAGTVTLTGLFIRLYIHLAINPHYGRDDFFLLGAAFVALCESILVFVSVSKGFGNSADLIDHGNLISLRRAFFSSEILYIFTLYLTKCCVICIFLKLTPKKTHNRATLITLGFCTLWVIGSLLTVGIKSGITDTTTIRAFSQSYCKFRVVKWQVIVSFDVLSEVVIFLLAVYLIRELQMRLRTKLIVLSAFAARLPDQTNLTLDLVDSAVWTQISINYNVIACTIFALKPFTAAVSTNYGTAGSQSLHSSKNNTNLSGGSNSATGSALDNGYSRDLENQGTNTSRSKEHAFLSKPYSGNGYPQYSAQKARRKSQLSTTLSKSISSKAETKSTAQISLPRFSLFSKPTHTPQHRRLKSTDENHELKSISGHNRTNSRIPFLSKSEKRRTDSVDSHGVAPGMGPVASDAIIDPPAATATTTTTAITAGRHNGAESGSGTEWNDDKAKLIIKKDIEYTVQYGD
ncbi:uncharacterized protein GIQ15_04182 [Arthroderma uncinatum]|uniref:uncharacterized protein n=1 Tax=Arthroderma uncinatum TaxID=74035 RepID=UPI00144A8D7F|nr:uncharacterized protein GIQ15_04182 [Arthroderma uncinatum]KAF3481423.1 hypothetical protein GIQ15_04182 [Arthroderma uncinatum]